MDNETFLRISYVVVLACSVALSLVTYGLLRRRFAAVCDDAAGSRIVPVARRLFLFGIVAPSLAGFLSVSYISCEKGSYAMIVTDRAYLIGVNQDQLQAALTYVIAAILVWSLVVLAIVLTSKKT